MCSEGFEFFSTDLVCSTISGYFIKNFLLVSTKWRKRLVEYADKFLACRPELQSLLTRKYGYGTAQVVSDYRNLLPSVSDPSGGRQAVGVACPSAVRAACLPLREQKCTTPGTEHSQNRILVLAYRQCCGSHWFQCGSEYGSGSRSKVLMTKNWTAEIFFYIFYWYKLQFTYP